MERLPDGRLVPQAYGKFDLLPGLTHGGRWRLDLQAAVDPRMAQELEPFVYERGMS